MSETPIQWTVFLWTITASACAIVAAGACAFLAYIVREGINAWKEKA